MKTCRLALVAACLLPGVLWAQPTPPRSGIYTCTDAQGRRLTADRPIAECRHKEQQILNKDGSVRGTLAPTLTVEERTAQETRERKSAEAKAAASDAARRDRNLKSRFSDEAAHQRAREGALETVRQAMRATELRIRDLQAARKPLMDEAEFYAGKTLPPKLRGAIDGNDAAMEAQRAATLAQQSEVDRVNRLYDIELDRLRRLWAGAVPGSLGPLPAASAPDKRTAAQR